MIDSDFITYLKTVDTPTLSNAIEELRCRPRADGFAPLTIRSLFPDLGRMCGYAVTAQVETVTCMSALEAERFYDLFAAVEIAPKPAVVVVQEIGGNRDLAAHCGEVMATIFTRLGAVGLVSDCGVRDLPEVHAVGMHYFARGSVASHAHFRIVRCGEPVQIDGLVIRPGDLLHGDVNGLLVVPSCNPAELQAAVDNVRRGERELLDYIRGEQFSMAGLRARFLH
jgi:4-hydroxy-4-methyl-2-oxoglutarate aldolase